MDGSGFQLMLLFSRESVYGGPAHRMREAKDPRIAGRKPYSPRSYLLSQSWTFTSEGSRATRMVELT